MLELIGAIPEISETPTLIDESSPGARHGDSGRDLGPSDRHGLDVQ